MKRGLLYAALGGIAVWIVVAIWDRPSSDHPFFASFERYPLVIAHADDTGLGLWPGNTMHFLENVAAFEVDALEMDIHMTRDGHIVLMHDDTVDRTTDGTGRISDMALDEINVLEVGGQLDARRRCIVSVPRRRTARAHAG